MDDARAPAISAPDAAREHLEVLSLEDDPADAELIQAALAADGLHCRMVRVDTRTAFTQQLGRDGLDLILADYSLPSFDGMSALAIARERRPDVPFILVSGVLGEEPAIEALIRGATDYVLKHRLVRLGPSVRRALAESEEREERRRAEDTAHRLLVENRELARRLMDHQERERRHLARELHDEIGQSLTAIKTEAEVLRRRVGPEDELVCMSAQSIQGLCNDVYQVVHSMLERLRPAALDALGLVGALRDTVQSWESRQQGVRCVFEVEGEIPDLSERVSIALFRVAQECLTNVARHADASQVRVLLAAVEDGIRLEVRDDGPGLGPGHAGPGFGMVGMRERIEALGGELALESQVGEGLAVVARVAFGAGGEDEP